MTLTRDSPSAAESRAVGGRGRLAFTRVLLPVGVALWALGISQAHVKTLQPWGLLPNLPAAFWAGVVLLVVSAAIELALAHPSRRWMAVHAVALVVILYGTAPLVYSQGRYAWLYKTVGVIQYVNAHGQLDRHIDIYQNWPGFFAVAAWFDKVAGVASPLAYAKWAQLIFELAALPLLYLIYRALRLTDRQLWAAMLLYPAANWIAQDYLSPQALGTLLSLGIMAIALRWLHESGPAAKGPRRFLSFRLNRGNQAAATAQAQRNGAAEGVRSGWLGRLGFSGNSGFCAVLMLVFFVLTFTHQLSPYIVAIQLGTLAAVRLLRPRWIPVALAAIALGYLAPRFAFVNQRYGLLASIGRFFTNIEPPHTIGAPPMSQRWMDRCAELLSVSMWAGAALSGWRRRRLGRLALTPVFLAFSPVVVLVAQAYGNEGIMRVYLFSLPWTAALVASLLVPGDELAAVPRNHRAPVRGWLGSFKRTAVPHVAALQPGRSRLRPGTVRAPLAIALALALFFPVFFGDDSAYVIPKSEVTTVTSFLQNASPGPIYTALVNAPLADTARYNQFPLLNIFGDGGMVTTTVTPAIADEIANDSLNYTQGIEPAYIMVTSSMSAYIRTFGLPPSNGTSVLLADLAQSPSWELVLHRSSVWIYELPPAAAPISTGGAGGGRGHGPQPPPPVPGRSQSITSAGQTLNTIVWQFTRQLGKTVTASHVISTTYAYQHGQLSAKLRAYMGAGNWNAPTPAGQHFWA